jgi:hypothetical protein
VTTRQEWATGYLAFCGWEMSAEKVLGIVAWAVAEGSDAKWNPLDTTEPAPGATDYNSAHVKNYPSLQVGYEATLATMKNGYYPRILASLSDPSGGSALGLAAAVGSEPWGTGNFSRIVELVKADPAPYFDHVVAGSGTTPPNPHPGPGPNPPKPTTSEAQMMLVESSDGKTYLVSGNTKVYIPDTPDSSNLYGIGIPVVKLTAAFVDTIPNAT